MEHQGNKYYNYMIIDQRHNTPQMSGPRGEISSSGPFKIGNNFIGNEECVNNYTGRGYYANGCGYWFNANPQFNKAPLHKNHERGALHPTKIHGTSTSPPQVSTVYGYARIGEEFRTY